MHSCDVAIVGAGLAGLQCARLLATRGLRVILLDRKASVAGPVHTTGIFVRKTWEDFPLPDEQLGRPIRDVFLYSPSGRSFRLTADHDEFRVGRMQWIHLYLLEQCIRAGVRWLPSTRLISCQRTQLVVCRGHRMETILARYVVGADGTRSAVARHLRLDRNSELLVGLEEIVETPPRAAALHCFLDPRIAPGYIAWVVGDGSESHVGVAGYRSDFDPSRALSAFRERVRHLAPGRVLERRGGVIPVNGILRRIANGNGLLVGDAAGAVSPLTAGGLDGALRLSAYAADVIAAYLDCGDPAILRAYDGGRLQTRFIARRWMRRLLRTASHPWVVEAAFALLHLPPLRALAEHVFFSRGSFPDVSGDHLVYVRNQSANAG
jgi:geranylgeranyl reductase family protein